ncbi:MAG TPA: peptidoglycan-associated lipoprotein Pal [Nevskiales bacterium]|nr:peptidoglycan-associated lipoprotein Pal [Nevskiales bacterium]
MKALIKVLGLTSSLALLAACSSTGQVSGGADAAGAAGAGGAGGAGTYPYGGGAGVGGQALGGPGSSAADRIVYFDFDSFEVRPDQRPVVENNARYLSGDPAAAAVLEGHTDERGSREYNVALGERRANAVRQMMAAYGVQPQQLRVVSYGEERPAVAGGDESAYAQNRRVEIVY